MVTVRLYLFNLSINEGSYFQQTLYLCIYIYICVCIYIYNSKSLDVVQSLYFGSKLPSSGMYK